MKPQERQAGILGSAHFPRRQVGAPLKRCRERLQIHDRPISPAVRWGLH